jgi:hypothetical protein
MYGHACISAAVIHEHGLRIRPAMTKNAVIPALSRDPGNTSHRRDADFAQAQASSVCSRTMALPGTVTTSAPEQAPALIYCCEVFHRASLMLSRCVAGQGMEILFGHVRCSAAGVLQVLVSSGSFSGAGPSASLETAARVQLSPHGEKRDEFASPIFVGSAAPAGFLSSGSIHLQKKGNP